MGNIIGSFVSGFVKVIGDLLGAPLDFLSGKSCSSVCGSTWDLICYIENFCVANLLKLVAVLVLFYIVLLFIYLLYKIGICDCLCRGSWKMLWSCLASCYHGLEYACTFLWFKLQQQKRMKEDLRDLEDYYSSSSEDGLVSDTSSYKYMPRSVELRRSWSMRSRDRRRIHLERSLRPRSHRIGIGISTGSAYVNQRHPGSKHGRHVKTVHDIRVTRTSKFVRKGSASRVYRRRRW